MIQSKAAPTIQARVMAASGVLHAPQVIDLEVIQTLRRFIAARELTADRATQAFTDFQAIRLIRAPHPPLASRIWELRDTLSSYDAAYVALAELLKCPLVTRDMKLSRTQGHRARIELVG